MAHIVDAIMVTLGLDTSKYTTQAENAIKTDVRLEKSLDKVEKKGGEVSKNFDGLAKAVQGAAKVFASLAAATGIIRFLQNVAEETRQANEEMLKLQASLGLTAEKINGMRGAGAALGGTAEGMTSSMKSLNKGMNDFVVKGDTTLLPFMNTLGVSMVDSQGKLRDVDKVMLDLSDSFSKMNSEQAYALGQDMGFDEGTIAALMQGRDAMKEMSDYHAKMYTSSKEELAASRELSKNQAQLSAHWQSMKLMLGNAIIPLLVKLTNFAKAFFEFLQDHQKTVKNVFEAMAFVLGAVLIPLFGKALIAALAFIAPFAPFILVVTALAAAFTLLYDDYKVWAEGGQSLFDWGKFSSLIDGAKMSVDSLTKGFGELADKVMAEVIPTLKGYGSIVQKLFSGDFAGASAEAKEMFTEFGLRAKKAVTPAWNKAADFVLGGAFKMGDKNWRLGDTSRRFETSGRGAGTISTGKGDKGGVSYGSYQMSSKMGTVQDFIKNSSYAGDFKGLAVNSDEFKAKWRELAKDPAFEKAQHDYIKRTHYDVLMGGLAKRGLDLSKKGAAVQDAIWSTSVQFGGSTKVIDSALKGKDISKLSDQQIVEAIQDYKHANTEKLFRSSPTQWKGLRQRAKDEKKALSSLAIQQGAAQAQGMVQQSATPSKLYNSKGLQSDMQSRSVDVTMGDLNIYTTASSVSGITSDAMRGVEASLNNLGTSMA